jgi:hypothetical protein
MFINMPMTLNRVTNFFFHFYRMVRQTRKNNRKNTRKNNRKNNRKTNRKSRRGGQRANASTCPPGQMGVNFARHGGECGPTDSSYNLMMGVTSN